MNEVFQNEQIYFSERTILSNGSARKQKNRWKMNNNLENERIQIFYCTTEEKPNVVNKWWMNLGNEWGMNIVNKWRINVFNEWWMKVVNEW